MSVVDVCKNNCSAAAAVSGSSDLMVVQCNASNQYGYSLVNGYLNVFGQSAPI